MYVHLPSDWCVCCFISRIPLHSSVACTGFLQQVPSPTSTQYVPLKSALMLRSWSKESTTKLLAFSPAVTYLHSWGLLKPCFFFFFTQETSNSNVAVCKSFVLRNILFFCFLKQLTVIVKKKEHDPQTVSSLNSEARIPVTPTQSPEHHKYFWKGCHVVCKYSL